MILLVSKIAVIYLKPGAIFAGWLVLAGLGRFIIEFFRPDQPRIPGTDVSITQVVASLMALAGALWLLVRYQVLRLPALTFGPDEYTPRELEDTNYQP